MWMMMLIVWRERLKKPNASKRKPTISLRAGRLSSLHGLGSA
ncbi:hypothetical protein Lser_V15G45713 [Lactuca serriola]